MKRPRAGRLTLIGVVAVAAIVGLAQPLQNEPSLSDSRVADAAVELVDDFTLRVFSGGTFTLSEHLAEDRRPLIVNFWATWCIPCRAEMPILQEYAEAHPEVVILGIATESNLADAKEFATSVGALYPLALDETGVVTERFEVAALPTTILINSDGERVATVFGELEEQDLDELLEKLK